DMEQRLQEARDRGAPLYDPVRVAEAVDLKTITLVEENKPRLGPAVLVTDDVERSYPNGPLAGHVLGYTGMVTADDLAAAEEAERNDAHARKLGFDDILGKSGIEKQYDRELSGE